MGVCVCMYVCMYVMVEDWDGMDGWMDEVTSLSFFLFFYD